MEPATASSGASTARAEWVRVWLAGLAFLYPAFWLSNFVLLALPALVRVALFGHRLEDFRVTPHGAFASSAPLAPIVAAPGHGPRFDFGMLAVAVLAVVLGLAWAGRRRRTPSGVMVATLGSVLAVPSLVELFFLKQNLVQSALYSLLFFGTLCVGLGWMLDAWVRSGYWHRAASAFAGLVLPLALLFVGLRWFSFEFRPILLLLIVPGALAALLVSLRPLWREPLAVSRSTGTTPDLEAAGWKTVGWGVATSLVLALAIGPSGRVVNRASARARSARAQAALASIPEVPPNAPYPRIFFQKGVNFTAEWPNRYDAEGSRQMLKQLPAYGINAIALVPYGWSSPQPPRVHIGGGPDTWESDEGVEELARLGHALGLKVMLKPAIWDSYKLEIPSAQDRAAWFDQYRLFLEHYARLAARIHADVFFVGGEFNHLSRYDSDWRKLIARARELYPGPLVYGANFGEEFETLTFWDALDYIGLQEYYPLPDSLSTDALVAKVAAVQRKYAKPVIFTEAGFSAHAAPNHQPWEDNQGGKVSTADQARCYEAVLRAFYRQPWFEGVYWWKVGTDGDGGAEDGSLTPWGKPAMDVVKQWYAQGGR